MIDLLPIHFIHQTIVAGVTSTGLAAPAEPPTQCEIRLPRWCIAGFDGRIEATDTGRYRTWALHSRLYMENGPLLIVEDKACSGRHDTTSPRALPRRIVRDSDGKKYISASYLIGARQGCKLEFRIPLGEGPTDRSYEHRMKFGILICTDDNCRTVLDKSSGP